MQSSREDGVGTRQRRRRRSSPIHVPTLKRRLREIGKPLKTLVDEARRTRRLALSVVTFQRGLRDDDIDDGSIEIMAAILDISPDELRYGTPTPPVLERSRWHQTGAEGEIQRILAMAFARDAQRMIRSTSLIDLRNVELELQRFCTAAAAERFESFYEALASQAAQLADLDALQPKKRTLRAGERTLRVHCPQTLLTTLLLFRYLRDYEQIRIDIDLDRQHSALPLVDRVQQDISDDLLALPLSAAVLYYQSTPKPLYSPIALLPRGSHRLVDLTGERHRERLRDPEIVLLPGRATAPGYFQALQRHKVLRGHDIGVACDPTGPVRSSEMDATSAVLWFPRNIIYEVLQRGRYLDNGKLEVASKESVLLIRTDLLEKQGLRDEILALLSTAHAALTENQDLIPLLVCSLFEQAEYRKAVLSEVDYASFLDR
jgi:hypothetical protein